MDNLIQYEAILIRYGELYTKKKNRKQFISRLFQQIRTQLKEFSNCKFQQYHDGILITLHGEDPFLIGKKLQYIFGISRYYYVVKTTTNLNDIATTVFKMVEKEDKSTFKIIAKRKDKNYPHSSDEINRYVASEILSKLEHKVDVKNPKLAIHIEVQSDYSLIMQLGLPCQKGYPVGTIGKSLLMMSGGIDSPVAAYYSFKRGVKLDYIHFASMPYTSMQSIDKVKRLVKKLSSYQGDSTLYIVPFTKLQLAIYKHCDESYAITIMRRMMYRISDEICKRKKMSCFVTGENLGQVASQTIESMDVMNKVVDSLVLRPLTPFDKVDIMETARNIGTYDISIEPFEDCCTIFKPKNPIIKPQLEKCEYFEKFFDYESLMQECIENIEKVSIKVHEEEDIFHVDLS